MDKLASVSGCVAHVANYYDCLLADRLALDGVAPESHQHPGYGDSRRIRPAVARQESFLQLKTLLSSNPQNNGKQSAVAAATRLIVLVVTLLISPLSEKYALPGQD